MLTRARCSRRGVAVTVVLLASLHGCASTEGDGPDDPLGQADAAEQAVVDEIAGAPAPHDARPFGPAAVDGTTTSQSFRIPGTSPEGAITDYAALAEADGWEADAPPSPTGTTDWAVTLRKDGASLLVTSSPAEPDRPDAELSLELTSPG